MLQQRGYYVIELSDGTKVSLRFCFGSFRRFSEQNGNLTLHELFKMFNKDENEESRLTLNTINSLLLCSAEYIKLSKGEPCTYTEYDVDEWISDLGGVGSPRLHQLLAQGIKGMLDTGETANGEGKKKGEAPDMGAPVGHGSRVELETLGT